MLDLSILKACGGVYVHTKQAGKDFLLAYISEWLYKTIFLPNSCLKGKDLQVFCNSYVHVLKFVAWISRYIWKITSSHDRLFSKVEGFLIFILQIIFLNPNRLCFTVIWVVTQNVCSPKDITKSIQIKTLKTSKKWWKMYHKKHSFQVYPKNRNNPGPAMRTMSFCAKSF